MNTPEVAKILFASNRILYTNKNTIGYYLKINSVISVLIMCITRLTIF